MDRLPANTLTPGLPPALEALEVCHRPTKGPCLRLWAGGDVGFSGLLRPLAAGEGAGPLSAIAPILDGTGLAFANLETPLVPETDSQDLFAAPSQAAERLEAAGFDLLNLANNHIRDYGAEGLEATLEALHQRGIRTVGAGPDEAGARAPAIFEEGGLTLGFLACGRTLQSQDGGGAKFWEYDPDELLEAVRETGPSVDILIVSIHIGYMFVDYPHPDHRRVALDLAEAGAHLVLMHHAHVLQGVEVTEGGAVICYNLGNLLFDWTEGEVPSRQEIEHQRSGALFGFDLDARGVARAFALPIRVDDELHLQWAGGGAGASILDRLEGISDFSRGDNTEKFWHQRAQRNTGQTLETLGRKLRQGDLSALIDGARRLRIHHLRMLLRWVLGRGKKERGVDGSTRRSGEAPGKAPRETPEGTAR